MNIVEFAYMMSDQTTRRNRVNHESGAFAEYAVAKASAQRKIPDNLSFEEAATLPVAIMTLVRPYQTQGREIQISAAS